MTDPQTTWEQDPDDERGALVDRGPFVIATDPDREYDAETIDATGQELGGPVDPPERRPAFADITSVDDQRRAIVPAWMRSRDQRRKAAEWAVGYVTYHTLYRLSRSPLYAAKVAFWAPVGAGRLVGRTVGWARAEEGNWSLRQHAATRNDSETWLKLDARRQAQASWRWWVVAAAAALLLILGLLLAAPFTPGLVRVPVLVALVLILARVGRPADRPILDRITRASQFTRLTAEMVRTAICSIGLTGVKTPAQITFPEDIHRDGPGYLARVNLPAGVEAVDVLERRGKLSSALRLPIDQVWPSAGPDHAGQLDLWVGYQPASKMGQPVWSLASPSARTSVFEPFEFGTDERQRPVTTSLFARNFLLGGAPGSGKSYGARTLALGAALDPIAELKIAEFKGTADFGDLAEFCSTYVCGVDDAAMAGGAAILAWGLAEAERRGKRILAARQRGEAPEGKVTPELARKAGSGLHPIVIVIDEAHELFGDEEHGKKAAHDAERLIKRGRALGIIVILATQIPDKTSLPPNITRCVTVRWCLAVQDQVANDMILGTGAYKRGLSATCYRPGADAGWGVITGLATAGPVRSHFPDQATTAQIIARIAALRGGSVVGGKDTPDEKRDVLDDVRRIFVHAERGAHWDVIAARLADAAPELYGQWTPGMVRDALKLAGVPTVDINTVGIDGQRSNRKGCRVDAVAAAIDNRALGSR